MAYTEILSQRVRKPLQQTSGGKENEQKILSCEINLDFFKTVIILFKYHNMTLNIYSGGAPCQNF
jgi:hypothetical protein